MDEETALKIECFFGEAFDTAHNNSKNSFFSVMSCEKDNVYMDKVFETTTAIQIRGAG